MTYSEYEKLISESLSNVDKAPANMKAVLDALKTDCTTLTSQTEKIKEQDTRIRDLQDTNMKLFLSTTSAHADEDEPEEELTGDDALNDFISKHTQKEA